MYLGRHFFLAESEGKKNDELIFHFKAVNERKAKALFRGRKKIVDVGRRLEPESLKLPSEEHSKRVGVGVVEGGNPQWRRLAAERRESRKPKKKRGGSLTLL